MDLEERSLVSEEIARGCDVLFDCVVSDGGSSNGVALDKGDSISGKEVVLHGYGRDLDSWV